MFEEKKPTPSTNIPLFSYRKSQQKKSNWNTKLFATACERTQQESYETIELIRPQISTKTINALEESGSKTTTGTNPTSFENFIKLSFLQEIEKIKVTRGLIFPLNSRHATFNSAD